MFGKKNSPFALHVTRMMRFSLRFYDVLFAIHTNTLMESLQHYNKKKLFSGNYSRCLLNVTTIYCF